MKKQDKNATHKRCTKCGELLPNTEEYFYFSKSRGYTISQCRVCSYILHLLKSRWNKEERLAYHKKWYDLNRNRLAIVRRLYREANVEKGKERGARYYKDNKAKLYKKNRLWAKNNPEKSKAHQLRFNYKLEEDAIREMLDSQKGCCAICGVSLIDPESTSTYCIDHCHETNRIRGLLCRKCNSGLGLLQDDPNICFNAYVYLKGY